MHSALSLVLFASFLFIVNGLTQDFECSSLDINTELEQPINGADLKYCKTNTLQCCDNAYFMKRKAWILNSVTEDIQEQIENQVENLDHIVDGVEKALREDFIPQFSRNYCGPVEGTHCMDTIKDPLARLLAHLVIMDDDDGDGHDNDDGNTDNEDENHDNDNDGQFSVDGVVKEFVNATVHLIYNYFVKPQLPNPPTGSLSCIQSTITVREAELNNIQKNLTQIRRAVTALMRLRSYVKETALPKFLAIPPTNSCIDAFINTRCKACSENITDTCRGTCNALMFGCIIPYAVGLRDQFDLLWNSTYQIVNITNKLLNATGTLPHTLFNVNITDAAALTKMLNEKCNLGLPTTGMPASSRRRRDDAGDVNVGNDADHYKLPSAVSKNSSQLLNSGAFGNNNAPKTCQVYIDTDCWNGTNTVAMNNVHLNVDNIDELIDNSPFAEYYSTPELMVASESFEPLIGNYLKSESFQTVAPEGLFITDDDGGDDNSGSATILAHFFLVVMCFLISFIF